MINLYRILSYDAETIVNFQGSAKDVAHIGRLAGFTPRRTKRSGSYEREYYLYLRGSSRQEKEAAVLSYLQDNYDPPHVEASRYLGTNRLPDDGPANEWPHYLATRIQKYFSEGHSRQIGFGGLGHQVFRSDPIFDKTDLKVFEGVTFRITVGVDFKPVIQIDNTFRYMLDGKEIRRSKAFAHFAEDAEGSESLRGVEIRDTDSVFNLVRLFMKSLPTDDPLLHFENKPMTGSDDGWNTWLWTHDCPVHIEASDGSLLNLPIDLQQADVGMYSPPENTVLIVVYPDDKQHELFPHVSGKQLMNRVTALFSAVLPQVSVPIEYLPYSLLKPDPTCLDAATELLEKHRDRKPLFLMIAPPADSRTSIDSRIVLAEQLSGKLGKQLRRLRREGYLLTLNWDKLLNDYDLQFIVENAILKGLTVLGAVPWRIAAMPCDASFSPEGLCFIGLDLNINRHIPLVGGVVFDGYGVACGYHMARLEDPSGDAIGEQELIYLISGLLGHFRRINQRKATHLIIHRDGIFRAEEVMALVDRLATYRVVYDLVDVRKSGAPRLRQEGNISGTPSKDLAVGNDIEGIAYLSNTLSVGQRMEGSSWLFPATDSIGVIRRAGNTHIKILAAQVHALSLAHFANYRRTVRLPATTAYADALVNNAYFPDSVEAHCGKTLDGRAQPYWL